jgi:uncharacterized membrane-anchored protein
MRSSRTLAVLILALLLASAVVALAQEAQEVSPALAGGMLILVVLAVVVGLVVQIIIIVFLYKDAQARSQAGTLWAILGLLFGWIALIVWLIIRPKQ